MNTKLFIVARHPNDLSEDQASKQSEDLADKIGYIVKEKTEGKPSPSVAIFASTATRADFAIRAVSSRFEDVVVIREGKYADDITYQLEELMRLFVGRFDPDVLMVIAHYPTMPRMFAFGAGLCCGYSNAKVLSKDYAQANVLDCSTGKVFLL